MSTIKYIYAGVVILILLCIAGCYFLKDFIKDNPITITIGQDTTSNTYAYDSISGF